MSEIADEMRSYEAPLGDIADVACINRLMIRRWREYVERLENRIEKMQDCLSKFADELHWTLDDRGPLWIGGNWEPEEMAKEALT